MDIISGHLFSMFAHLPPFPVIQKANNEHQLLNILIKKGMPSSTLVVLGVPVYICLIRPYYHCGLNMLKHMGIGIVFL